MQVNNEHSDNIFKQKAEEIKPDLNAMDAHWQQLKNSVLGNVTPRNSSAVPRKLYKLFAIAATVTGIALFYLFSKIGDDKKQNIIASHQIINKETKIQAPVADSLSTQVVVTAVPYTHISSASSKQKSSTSNPLPASAEIDSSSKNETGISEVPKEQVTKNLMIDFYNKIEKPAQEFTINASTGGKITGKEGTILTIPAAVFTDASGSVVSGEIKILMEEYYKYSDIVAANLTTMSDGKQLETGGMIKLTAIQNGKPINVQPGKAIDLSMPTKNYDPEMSLFTALSETNKEENDVKKDFSYSYPGNRKINWNLAAWQSYEQGFDGKLTFTNMEDMPAKVRGKDGRIAVFKIADYSGCKTADIKEILTKRYGDYYRKIIVKKVRPHRSIFDLFGPKDYTRQAMIGGQIRLSVSEAIKKLYINRKDSGLYIDKVKQEYISYMLSGMSYNGLFGNTILNRSSVSASVDNHFVDSLEKEYKKQLKRIATYSFKIKNMGWVNCDRFSNYEPRTDFVISLPDGTNANNFVSQLVFTDIRSVMPGNTYENKVGFLNIPKNMNVYLVGLGEKDGKVVSFMEKLKVGAAEVNINKLTETTPENFKKQIAALDL